MADAGVVMVSLRPMRIASTSGHTVTVTPEGTWVPNVLVTEALARGCAPKAEVEQRLAEPTFGNREEQVDEAIAELIAGNDPKNFTTANKPKINVVKRIVGFDVSSGDIDAALARLADADNAVEALTVDED